MMASSDEWIERLCEPAIALEELPDEIVWGTIARMGWIAGPELFFALRQYIADVGLIERVESEAEKPKRSGSYD
jgi:hypothetical protein